MTQGIALMFTAPCLIHHSSHGVCIIELSRSSLYCLTAILIACSVLNVTCEAR